MAELSREHLGFISEHFPEPYNDPDRFGEYILPKIQLHDTLCTAVMAEVKTLLATLIERHDYRFFCRIDDTHRLKSPDGIVDKICRSLKERESGEGHESGAINLDNFLTQMTDLARFRIVCNFLSDIEKIAEIIKKSEKLNSLFKIQEKSTIQQRPKDRKSGERSVKISLEHKKSPGLFLEIQIMTQLEEAWDKKDHFLVYETHRREPLKDDEHFKDFLDAKMLAMSELLYIADNYFDELRGTREEKANKEETL